MPPLPPLLGPSRAPTDRRAHTVPPADGTAPDGPCAVDDALDDTQLRGARAALAQGRRQAARSLLLHTGDDWDRRAHRLTVLAREPYAASWARDWQLAEPDSADAAALLALALVQRALRGREEPGTAMEACHAAAALAPADPTPWLGLLLLARTLGSEREVLRLFAEVHGRHPEHHHAHHLLIARIAERPGSGPESHEVYDLAELAAAEAPADSPLAVLPVVAYAERYRVLTATGLLPAHPAATDLLPTDPAATGLLPADPAATGLLPAHPAATGLLPTDPAATGLLPADPAATGLLPAHPAATGLLPADPAATGQAPAHPSTGLAPSGPAAVGPVVAGHWSGPRARRVLNAAFAWWLEWEHDDHPRRHIDLNHLAFAMHRAGRSAEAAVLFQRIGRHATAVPWSYPHRDPWTAFRTARAHVLGGRPAPARPRQVITES
ncbi:hypothetical protein [Streptomyces sp. L2]|uniref:hypothetical protein n=1 Tax=Streptomyces sp. L2 TaxID=2162665 RepID=UPI001F512960|nr:hypothetical protein [Streptomyces sp. L2]